MAQLCPNLFSSYILTEQEELEGQLLNSNQKAVLRTKRSEIAAEKLLLSFDVNSPGEYAQTEAYLRGQLDAITWLLDTSDDVEFRVKSKNAASNN